MPKQYAGGLFSPPVFNATADPYNDSRNSASNQHGASKGNRQFAVGHGMNSKFQRLYEGEDYKSMSKLESQTRMEGKAKFLTPSGFKQSSGIKINSCPGDWSVTFQRKPPVYIPEGENRGPRKKIETFKSRLIYTQPPKKAVGSTFSTPNIHFTKLVYEESPYDAAIQVERARTADGKRKMEGKPPFKGISLGSNPLLSPIKSPSDPESRAQSAGRHRKKGGDEPNSTDAKPFVPAHTMRSGAEYSVFTRYPVHEPDPYDEKILRGAGSSGRLLPMAEQLKTMDETLRERRPWSPNSPAKTMYSRVLDPGL